MTTFEFVVMEVKVEAALKSKPDNVILQDFWKLIEAHRALLRRNEELETAAKLVRPPL